MSRAIDDVLRERQRQVEVEGFTAELDDFRDPGEIGCAGVCYALLGAFYLRLRHRHEVPSRDDREEYQEVPPLPEWPWASGWWKPTEPRRDLVKAAALLIAEIERIDRAEAAGGDA